MARTVRDIALALQVMAGPDGQDWYAIPVPVPDVRELDARPNNLRIGWMAEKGFSTVDLEVAATIARVAEKLEELGFIIEPVHIPGLEKRDGNALSMTLFTAESGIYFEPIVAGRHDQLYPVLRNRLAARIDSLQDYLCAEGLRQDLAEYFRRYDLLLCPTVPVPAHVHDASQLSINGEGLPPRHVVRTTVPFNLTGSPALSVPFGWDKEGLPMGVQLVGRRFAEKTLLQVGMALESVRENPNRRPPV